MCHRDPETVGHFLVECSALEEKRCIIMDSIVQSMVSFTESPATTEELVQIILDCSKVTDRSSGKHANQSARDFEKKKKKLTRRLVSHYSIHQT